MLFTPLTAVVLAIVFFAALTRAAIGFGDALLAIPLLTVVITLQTAVPLMALLACTMSTVILLGDWRKVNIGAAWRLIVSSIVGIPFGLYALIYIPERGLKIGLGLLLVGFALYELVLPRLTLHHPKAVYLFGFIAGIFGGATSVNGPVVVVYGALSRWPPTAFRATLQGYFLPVGVFILIGHAGSGLWTPEVVGLFLWALPVVLGALYLGGLLHTRIPPGAFDRVVYALLLVMGCFLVVN